MAVLIQSIKDIKMILKEVHICSISTISFLYWDEINWTQLLLAVMGKGYFYMLLVEL